MYTLVWDCLYEYLGKRDENLVDIMSLFLSEHSLSFIELEPSENTVLLCTASYVLVICRPI